MEKEKYKELIKSKFSVNYELVEPLLRDTIRIETEADINIKPGQSKFGGIPTMHETMDWPIASNGLLLSFFAQINLEDIDIEKDLLPKSGMLYFFILTENVSNRFPEEKDEFKVIYSESKVLFEKDYDQLKVFQFSPVRITFSLDFTLPYTMDDCITKNMFNEEEVELLEDMNYCHFKDPTTDEQINHHMLGWPNTLQYPVNILFAIKYFNLSPDVLNDEIFQEKMLEESQNFRVLLQISFEEKNTDFSKFGGEGMVYFGIHIDDLKNRNFNNVVVVFQNT